MPYQDDQLWVLLVSVSLFSSLEELELQIVCSSQATEVDSEAIAAMPWEINEK